MFNQIKSKIGQYFLRKEVVKKNKKSVVLTLSKAKKIGILFDAKSSDSIQSTKSFLKYLLNITGHLPAKNYRTSNENHTN